VLAENSPALLADLWAFRVAKKQDHLRQPPTGDASTTASVLEAKVDVRFEAESSWYESAGLGLSYARSIVIKLRVVAEKRGGKVENKRPNPVFQLQKLKFSAECLW
jgi:hypothetical protein